MRGIPQVSFKPVGRAIEWCFGDCRIRLSRDTSGFLGLKFAEFGSSGQANNPELSARFGREAETVNGDSEACESELTAAGLTLRMDPDGAHAILAYPGGIVGMDRQMMLDMGLSIFAMLGRMEGENEERREVARSN